MKSNQDKEIIGNILIVDNLGQNMRIFSQLLHRQGYEVPSVTNGKMT